MKNSNNAGNKKSYTMYYEAVNNVYGRYRWVWGMVTKLSLDTSKDDFVSRMEFKNDKERARCLLYLDVKGVAYHTVLVSTSD